MSEPHDRQDSKPSQSSEEASASSDGEPPSPEPTANGAEAEIPPSVVQAIRDQWAGKPAVEVELTHEIRSPPYVDQPWRMVEVWTQNRIYAMDLRMRCLDVIDRVDQKSVPEHKLLGAQLVGGQLRDGNTVHLTHPLPRPGTCAVFTDTVGSETRFSQTSAVARVVLRLRHVTIGSGTHVPSWDEMGGYSASKPPSGG